MDELSHKYGESSREVVEGAQNNCCVVEGCSKIGISKRAKTLVTSPEEKKNDPNIPSKTKIERLISFWKSVTSPISDNQDQGAIAQDSQNSRLDPNLKTIENWLNCFGVPTILPRLEESLEGVKRNKISKDDHEKLSKSVDKELQKLSLTFHPDHAGDQEWQSALNAIRTVLKTLTAVFLEDTFIDYKYEHFSMLDISILVNENGINNIIQAVYYKISVLSETKRMHIIGEIRKFLTESEKCVRSYFDGNKSDFEKYRNYALYHLQKNIEGYKKFEKECNMLIEECSKENDSLGTVVQNVASQSARESSILRSLECVARRSFDGNFEIFPVDKAMDEYYILPFVDYINVLSMCNLLLQPKCSRSFKYGISCKEERLLFTLAYSSASFVCYYKRENMEVTDFMHFNEYSNKLRETLGKIFSDLQSDYRVDAYNEGKSNREEMHEKLLALKNFLEDIQEKERAFAERVNRYKMERKESSESFGDYRQDTEESCKVGMGKQEKESKEDSSKLNWHWERDELHECRGKLSEMPSTERNQFVIDDCEVAEEVCINSAYL